MQFILICYIYTYDVVLNPYSLPLPPTLLPQTAQPIVLGVGNFQ